MAIALSYFLPLIVLLLVKYISLRCRSILDCTRVYMITKKKQIFLESQRMFSFPIKECGALFHARGTEGERIEVKNQRTWNKGSNDSVVNDVEARIDGKISRKSSTLPACASSVFWLYWLFNILISGLFKAFQALFRRISGYFPEVSNTGCKSFILLELGCAWGKTK